MLKNDFSAFSSLFRISQFFKFQSFSSLDYFQFCVFLENGREVTKTRVFEHPLSDEVLETLWDEYTLRYLLEQSKDYEERKRIRSRLRMIMAEQEACTELVKQASQDQSSQSIDGESLLLPLLQGLLDAPENEQTHDSGTESGEDQRSGLINEVQNALEKLASSLLSDSTEITPERRSSLLHLVTKLQAGLASATSDRRHSVHSRFNRRRERPNRHTIGVSSEELADARKLIEEISGPSQSSSRASILTKQNSDSNVQHIYSYPAIQQKNSVKNSTPKPFSVSNSASVSSTSSSVQTPSESVDYLSSLFNEDKYVLNQTSPIYDNLNDQMKTPPAVNNDSEEDDSTTMKKTDQVMQNNPIYYQPDLDKKELSNRFSTRKLKMRRANTIDIPKPLHFYEYDDEEDETDYEDEEKKRRNNYFALRGPIRLSNNAANRHSVPTLEPKTENDRKFLAFVNKHNEKNQRHSLWAGNIDRTSNWNNRFDNIKINFEKRRIDDSVSPNTARSFWKSADDSISHYSNKYDPKISKQSARNLKKMFEEKQKQQNDDKQNNNNIIAGSLKLTRNSEPEKSYRLIPQPLPVNKFSHAPSSAFQPFNRNPLVQETNEVPEISKTVLKVDDQQGSNRLYLYSPKPLNEKSVSPTSPNYTTKPWIGNSVGESRVLSIAAKKFENIAPPPTNSFQPRKLNRGKINTSHTNRENSAETLSAPCLVNTLDQKSNTVRKLSGQYDNLGSTNRFERPHFPKTPENAKSIEGFQSKFTVPLNYAITYEKPMEGKQGIRPSYKPENSTQKPWMFHQEYAENRKPSQNYQNNRENFENFPKYQAQAKISTQIFNHPIPDNKPDIKISEPAFKPKYESQKSVESLKEYDAINSRVMSAPVPQQASTVRQKSPMTRNEHDLEAAFALKNVLQKVNTQPPAPKVPKEETSIKSPKPPVSFSYNSDKTNMNLSPSQTDPWKPKSVIKNQSQFSESCEITPRGEHIVTSKFPLPSVSVKSPDPIGRPAHVNILSKSDSWHQICLMNQSAPQRKPIPAPPSLNKNLMKSKSTHSMIAPKQFEAGMSKDEVEEKKRTMEAFFGANSNQSPTNRSPKVIKRAINRTKTSEKNAKYREIQTMSGIPSGLARSRTLPDIVCPNMLDENNVDKAFEDLFNCS